MAKSKTVSLDGMLDKVEEGMTVTGKKSEVLDGRLINNCRDG